MSALTFVRRQVTDIRRGGRPVLAGKLRLAFKFALDSLTLPLDVLTVPVAMVIRLIRPWLLVRFGALNSSRIGHFGANTELYLCERDAGINVPKDRYVDFFYMGGGPICNVQLAKMWKRVLRIWPRWILASISRVNRFIPGGAIHDIGNNTQRDRDVHNLWDRSPPHLKFTVEEEAEGQAGLRAIGIPPGTPFVCLIVRDCAYLESQFYGDWSYHNFRDCDVRRFVLAAEELANRGYIVIRMGAVVKNALNTSHPGIKDYATNGTRSDFMDIYLGAKCEFCISTSTGWDAVPQIFRRPIVYANFVPLGYMPTYRAEVLAITKRHVFQKSRRCLTFHEIFTHGVGFALHTSDYGSRGIDLIENTPEEIRDVVIEMAERLNGSWQPHEGDDLLQKRFWEIFPGDALETTNKRPLHGEIRARFGAAFLRNNRDWLQ